MGNPWTPGPWEYEHGISPDGKEGYFVHKNGAGIWSDHDNDGGVCSEQDARLIAAAPEMAEALEKIRAALIAEAVAACTECGSRGFPRHSGCDSCTEAVDQMYPSFAILARIKGDPA